MPVSNIAVAAALGEIADRLEIQGANAFRIRAYRMAARTIQELPDDVRAKIERGETLAGLPGIGADLAGKIAEIATSGACEILRTLRREMPPAITELLQIPGLGPKRVRMLWQELGVQSAEQVLRAARDQRIRALHGFGELTERRIESAIGAHLSKERRVKLAVAAEYANALVDYLSAQPGVERVAVAGSFRRMRETVGDLDILVVASDGRALTERFAAYPDVEQRLALGPTKASVRLRSGLQVDLRVVARESFGAALVYFTGSKPHNIALRKLGLALGLKVNEYGVYRGAKRIAGDTEASVYAALGLPPIPPELREDQGELDAAKGRSLPRLVEYADLRGDLHAHTDATDGRDTLEAMVEAAQAAGLQYVAITDHSQRQAMSHGLDGPALLRQARKIARVRKQATIDVLHGIEVDILDDGALDLADAVLSRLDVVVAAVHAQFNLSRAKQTERILRALDNPWVDVLAHPTGRLIGEREPYDVDMAAVVAKARACGVHLELNAYPDRLDLTEVNCRMCKDSGVRVAIDSDAHSVRGFAMLRLGVGQARRGWLTADDVVNTRTLAELRPLLRRSRSARTASRAA